MKLIVGLGNPGPKYENTRHNIGFMVLDELAGRLKTSFSNKDKFSSEIAEGALEGKKLLLAKPQTFMNESGRAVQLIKSFYQLADGDLLLVQDEVDVAFGQLKLSTGSGSAGHRGVESVIEGLGKQFARLRVGIDNRQDRREHPTDSYVMARFEDQELAELKDKIIPAAIAKIEEWVEGNDQ